MICAADNGGIASRIIPETTSTIQTKSGIRMNVMPLHRIVTMVTMTFRAEAELPIPLTSKPRIQ